jgi:hypothetical protein
VTRIAESAQEEAELLSALRAGHDVEFRPASDGVLVTAAGAEVRLPYAVARGIHVVEAARPSVRAGARKDSEAARPSVRKAARTGV